MEEFITIPAKTIVTRAKPSNGWFDTEYNMNIYRGCSHGCIYCDSRSNCYQNTDFDVVKPKADALRVIRDDLRRKVKTGVIATGAMSDPYNPLEERLLLTRHALELVNAYGFGVAAATKSPLAARDADILKDIAAHSPVLVKFTITTVDDGLCKKIEPNVPLSGERFRAMKTLSSAGIYCGVLMMPLLPYINDTEENVISIARLAKENGARFVYPAFGLTMRDGQREYLYNALDHSFPGVKERYQKRFGTRYQCGSPNAAALWKAFKQECDRLGLLYRIQDINRSFRLGYDREQLRFF